MICKRCELHSDCITNCLGGTGSNKPVVLFVGEAPGKNEDEEGEAFIGRAGQLLRDCVEDANAEGWPVRYSNCVRCRPLANATPNEKQIKKCRPFLRAEILRTQPKIIVPLGATALESCLGETKITKVRGRKFVRDGFIYFPTFHPAYILRNPEANDSFIDDLLKIFDPALLEVKKADLKLVTPKEAYSYLKSKYDCHGNLSFSFDIEATSLDPYLPDARVLCIAFSAEDDQAIIVDIPILDGSVTAKAAYSDCQYWLRNIFTLHADAIAQNGKYDCTYLNTVLDVKVENWSWDTMLMAYALDEKSEHGLKAMAARHLPGYAGYEEQILKDLKTRKKIKTIAGQEMLAMDQAKPEMLHRYNGTDAVVTFLLWKKFKKELQEDGSMAYYRDVLQSITEALMRVQNTGCTIDLEEADRLAERINGSLALVEKQLTEHPTMVCFLKERLGINWNSPKQVADLLFGFEGLVATEFTEGTKDSENKQPKTRAKSLLKHDNELANLVVQRSKLSKLSTTYSGEAVRAWVRSDGLAHGEFNIDTVTGRLSCSNPNLQNIPKKSTSKEFNIKNLFVSRFEGGMIGVADYKQIELRIFAVLAKSKPFIEIFEAGGDPHGMVATKLFGVTKETCSENEWESKRGTAKNINFGLIYGETEHGLAENYGGTKSQWKKYLGDYYKSYPEITTFKKQIVAEMRRYKYVESPFGARRHFPDYPSGKWSWDEAMVRRGVNHPIQNSASTICCKAALRIQQAFDEHNWKSKVISLVHDMLLFDLYPTEIEPATWLIFDLMQNHGLEWVTIPLPIDYALGDKWGTAETI
jgi:DNA polymerase-1